MEPHKIEENLYNLLIKEKNKEVVILISGEWGLGKTYFWNNFIKKYKNVELKDKQIAYVSLFGISSLNDIKTSILLNLFIANCINFSVSSLLETSAFIISISFPCSNNSCCIFSACSFELL